MWSFLHLLTTQCFDSRLSSNEDLPQCRNRKHLRLRSCPAALRLAFVAEAKRRACSGGFPTLESTVHVLSLCPCTFVQKVRRAGLCMCKDAQLCATSTCSTCLAG